VTVKQLQLSQYGLTALAYEMIFELKVRQLHKIINVIVRYTTTIT